MSEDIVGQIKDIRGRTWQEAFYLQTKAFLEKNSEHIKEIERLKAEVERLTHRGDEMSIACLFYANMIRTHLIHLEAPPFNFPYPMSLYASANRWNAAKEGKQP